MDIASKQVYEALVEMDVKYIHHANSVITACQFLRQGSLMSRGTIELYYWPILKDHRSEMIWWPWPSLAVMRQE
jgi:hypothetical protein